MFNFFGGFMKVNKTLLMAALLSIGLSASVCSMDLLDNQESQNVPQLACYGFVNNRTLSLTEDSVRLVLDPRFDPNKAGRPAARNAKLFLQAVIEKTVDMYEDSESFYEILRAVTTAGPLQVDVTIAGFNVANEPSDVMIEDAVGIVFDALTSGKYS